MQTIKLNDLRLSESYNVRKINRDKHVDALVASIKAHGLLENLLVVECDNQFEVIAGGCRLKAMQTLQQDGHFSSDFAVPCEVVPAEQAEELSLVENSIRQAMHPADEFEAWVALIDQGSSIADIAARFGIRETLVKQRLKLGRVSAKLMQAYRDDGISLEILMAYTLTDDHDKQDALFDRFNDSWDASNVNTIRRALTEEAVSSEDKRVEFLGIDVYERAGGIIRPDLFEDESYLEDVDLLNQLVEEKLQLEAEAIKDQWSWVEVRADFPYEAHCEYQTIYAHALSDVPDQLSQRFDQLAEQLQAIDDDNESDDEDESIRRVRQELSDVEAEINSYRGFTDEERAIAGCVITLDYHGMRVCEGLIRPEDKKAASQQLESDDPSVAKGPPPRYSKALQERLENYRLHPVRLAMANDFDAAFDVAVYAMCNRQYGHQSEIWLGIHADAYYYPVRLSGDDDTLGFMQGEEQSLVSRLPLTWLNEDDESQRFTAFCSLTDTQKQTLFAACTATSMKPQLSTDQFGSIVFEAIGQRLSVDVAEHWRPTADNFLGRVTKAELLEIGTDILGRTWADNHRKAKKGQLVSILHEAFNQPQEWKFEQTQLDTLKTWLPEGMDCCAEIA